MLFKTLLFAAVASVAVASSTSTSTCSGQVILDACMGTIQAQINSCSATDYACLCSGWTSMVGCGGSAGCPNDPSVAVAQQQKLLNCNNASVYGSTSSIISAPASTAATATTTSEGGAQTGFASGSATGTSARSSSTGSTNGAENAKAASGILAVVAAAMAAML